MCFTDIDEALKVDADVVIIVMPHYAHIEFAKKAVLAGKNVLIEKPLCDNLARTGSSASFSLFRSTTARASRPIPRSISGTYRAGEARRCACRPMSAPFITMT